MNKRNEYFSLETNCEIAEYDIKSCNTSVCREYGLLSDSILDRLEKMEPLKRKVAFGKLQRKNKDLTKEFEAAKKDAVTKFMKQNNLDYKEDVVSIKNDAVFVFNKDISNTYIGKHINFRSKNIYHAYLFLSPYEFYFRNTKDEDGLCIDVKNLSSDKNVILRHKDGVLELLNEVISTIEKSGNNSNDTCELLHDICSNYKKRNMNPEIYREFNSLSKYKMTKSEVDIFRIGIEEDNSDIVMDEPILESDGRISESISILYNYMNIILPLTRVILN